MPKQRIKCDECGHFFYPGNDRYGVPAGVGLTLDDGTTINICKKCSMKALASCKADIKKAIKELRKEEKNYGNQEN